MGEEERVVCNKKQKKLFTIENSVFNQAWSLLLNKSLMENFFFDEVLEKNPTKLIFYLKMAIKTPEWRRVFMDDFEPI